MLNPKIATTSSKPARQNRLNILDITISIHARVNNKTPRSIQLFTNIFLAGIETYKNRNELVPQQIIDPTALLKPYHKCLKYIIRKILKYYRLFSKQTINYPNIFLEKLLLWEFLYCRFR